MCKSIGRCVAIVLIVIGVLILAGGILTLLGPQILDCDEIIAQIGETDEFWKDFCDNYEDVAKVAGIVSTSIGGVMMLAGILMLCCLRSKSPKVIQAAPVVATIPSGNMGHQYQPQPNYPYLNQPTAPPPQHPHQYENPMMMPQQQHYSSNPLAMPQGGYGPPLVQKQIPVYPELARFNQYS